MPDNIFTAPTLFPTQTVKRRFTQYGGDYALVQSGQLRIHPDDPTARAIYKLPHEDRIKLLMDAGETRSYATDLMHELNETFRPRPKLTPQKVLRTAAAVALPLQLAGWETGYRAVEFPEGADTGIWGKLFQGAAGIMGAAFPIPTLISYGVEAAVLEKTENPLLASAIGIMLGFGMNPGGSLVRGLSLNPKVWTPSRNPLMLVGVPTAATMGATEYVRQTTDNPLLIGLAGFAGGGTAAISGAIGARQLSEFASRRGARGRPLEDILDTKGRPEVEVRPEVEARPDYVSPDDLRVSSMLRDQSLDAQYDIQYDYRDLARAQDERDVFSGENKTPKTVKRTENEIDDLAVKLYEKDVAEYEPVTSIGMEEQLRRRARELEDAAAAKGKKVSTPFLGQVEGGTFKHFTTPEARTKLEAGEPFDASLEPQHGTGDKSRGPRTGKGQAGSVLHLSLDDGEWGRVWRSKPGGKIFDWDDPAGESALPTRGFYDYDKQKWMKEVGGHDIVDLVPVEYTVSPTARVLTIDSEAALEAAIRLGGQQFLGDTPAAWAKLSEQFDVVAIRNTHELSGRHKFFKNATHDQLYILNDDVVQVKLTSRVSILDTPPAATLAGVTRNPVFERKFRAILKRRATDPNTEVQQKYAETYAEGKKLGYTDEQLKALEVSSTPLISRGMPEDQPPTQNKRDNIATLATSGKNRTMDRGAANKVQHKPGQTAEEIRNGRHVLEPTATNTALIFIPFQRGARANVVAGKKTMTTRASPLGQRGDVFDVNNKRFMITKIESILLKDVPKHFKEEGFSSQKAFEEEWVRLHPRIGLNLSRRVYLHTIAPYKPGPKPVTFVDLTGPRPPRDLPPPDGTYVKPKTDQATPSPNEGELLNRANEEESFAPTDPGVVGDPFEAALVSEKRINEETYNIQRLRNDPSVSERDARARTEAQLAKQGHILDFQSEAYIWQTLEPSPFVPGGTNVEMAWSTEHTYRQTKNGPWITEKWRDYAGNEIEGKNVRISPSNAGPFLNKLARRVASIVDRFGGTVDWTPQTTRIRTKGNVRVSNDVYKLITAEHPIINPYTRIRELKRVPLSVDQKIFHIGDKFLVRISPAKHILDSPDSTWKPITGENHIIPGWKPTGVEDIRVHTLTRLADMEKIRIEVFSKSLPVVRGAAPSGPQLFTQRVLRTVATPSTGKGVIPDAVPLSDMLVSDDFVTTMAETSIPSRSRRLSSKNPILDAVVKFLGGEAAGNPNFTGELSTMRREVRLMRVTRQAIQEKGAKRATLYMNVLTMNGTAKSLFGADPHKIVHGLVERYVETGVMPRLRVKRSIGADVEGVTTIDLTPNQARYIEGVAAYDKSLKKLITDNVEPSVADLNPELTDVMRAAILAKVMHGGQELAEYVPVDPASTRPLASTATRSVQPYEDTLLIKGFKVYEHLADHQASQWLKNESGLKSFFLPSKTTVDLPSTEMSTKYQVEKGSADVSHIQVVERIDAPSRTFVLKDISPSGETAYQIESTPYTEREYKDLIQYMYPDEAPGPIKVLSSLAGVQRMMALTGDVAGPLVQLISLASYAPAIWVKSIGYGLEEMVKPGSYGKRMQRHTGTVKDSKTLIFTHAGSEVTDVLTEGWIGARTKTQVQKFYSPFQRFYETNMDMAGVLLREALVRPNMSGQVKAEIETFINQIRGLQSSSSLLLSARRRTMESAALLAPRYRRATLALYANALNDGIQGRLAREAITKGIVGIHLIFAATYAAMEYLKNPDQTKSSEFWSSLVQDRLNPAGEDYLNYDIGNWKFGVGSKMRSDLKFLTALMTHPQDILEISRENFALSAVESQLSIGPRTAIDFIRGTDYMGREVRGVDGDDYTSYLRHAAQNNLLPMAAQSLLEDSSWADRAGMFATSFAGMRARPLSESETLDNIVVKLNILPGTDQSGRIQHVDPSDPRKAKYWNNRSDPEHSLEPRLRGHFEQTQGVFDTRVEFSESGKALRVSEFIRAQRDSQYRLDERLKDGVITPGVWAMEFLRLQKDQAAMGEVIEAMGLITEGEKGTPNQAALQGYYDTAKALSEDEPFDAAMYQEGVDMYLSTLPQEQRNYVERNLYPNATPTIDKYRQLRKSLRDANWYELYKEAPEYGGRIVGVYNDYLKSRRLGKGRIWITNNPQYANAIDGLNSYQSKRRDDIRSGDPILDVQFSYWREAIPKTDIVQAYMTSRLRGMARLGMLQKNNGTAHLSGGDLNALNDADIFTLQQLRRTPIAILASILGVRPTTLVRWQLYEQIDRQVLFENSGKLDIFDQYVPS